MNYTKDAGYLIFVIPDFLFDSDQSDKLHAYIQEYAHIIGVIRLPESAFKSEKNVKSILILQKKGEDTQALKQPLLAKLPSFKNRSEEHTSELQSRGHLVCRLLLEKKK